MRKLGAILLLCLGIVALGAPAAQAGTVTLADLINQQGTIIQGDKLFSDFSFSLVASGPQTAPADASGIKIKPRTFGNGDHGLEFFGGMFAGVNSTLDMLIGYKVSVIDVCQFSLPCTDNLMITDIDLIFNGAVSGTGFTSVTETVLAPDQIEVLGQAVVSNPPQVLSQVIDLTRPSPMVFIMKDIFLFGGEDGTATISFIDQAVSQSIPPSSVPEPATLLLLGSGILGLAGRAAGRKHPRA